MSFKIVVGTRVEKDQKINIHAQKGKLNLEMGQVSEWARSV